MVCRGYKEISPDVSHLDPGGTREEQRANAAAETVVERETARAAVLSNDGVSADLAISAKRAKLSMGHKSIDCQQIENVMKQIEILEKMKATMVRVVGEDEYQDRMFRLTSSLPGWGPAVEEAVEDDLLTPVDEAVRDNSTIRTPTPTRRPERYTPTRRPERERNTRTRQNHATTSPNVSQRTSTAPQVAQVRPSAPQVMQVGTGILPAPAAVDESVVEEAPPTRRTPTYREFIAQHTNTTTPGAT